MEHFGISLGHFATLRGQKLDPCFISGVNFDEKSRRLTLRNLLRSLGQHFGISLGHLVILWEQKLDPCFISGGYIKYFGFLCGPRELVGRWCAGPWKE